MIEIEGSDLAKLNSGGIAKNEPPMSVGILEHELLEKFPRADAESWDRMGMIVGNPTSPVKGVLVALDPTLQVIEAAKTSGANVVLTHHPVFLDPPTLFSPTSGSADSSGIAVWNAIRNDIALINFHTALDASPDASLVLPALLSLDFEQILLPSETSETKGYGQICTLRKPDTSLKLSQLAARCVSVFGCNPRVWGADNAQIKKIALMNGSVGSLAPAVVSACRSNNVDCLICGEIRYHSALDASQQGLSIIELGHDVSEFPLTAVLAQAAVEVGVPKSKVAIFEQAPNWGTPDAIRV